VKTQLEIFLVSPILIANNTFTITLPLERIRRFWHLFECLSNFQSKE